jgi:hypothetical protein
VIVVIAGIVVLVVLLGVWMSRGGDTVDHLGSNWRGHR